MIAGVGFHPVRPIFRVSPAYDANGNLATDPYKGMAVAYQPFLNLPKTFTFAGNKLISVLYDASGRKLRKTVTDNGALQYTQDYAGGIEYRSTPTKALALESFYHAEGRVFNTNVAAATTTEILRYEYAVKDHLGNARLTFTDKNGNGQVDQTNLGSTNEIIQESHYYPFGLDLPGAWINDGGALDNLYKYNGKELNGDFGLGWMDYGARWYDGSVGRWWSVDPLVEQYISSTPYAYVGNNPLIFIDPDGRYTIFAGGAAFNGSVDPSKAGRDFTQNLIRTFTDILGEDDFHVLESGRRPFGMVSNSIWSIENGSEVLSPYDDKRLQGAIDEIIRTYKEVGGIDAQGKQGYEPLNLIGSSYGSVLIGQAAVNLVQEKGLDIKTLTLSASPINKESDLGKTLLSLEAAGKIGKIIWQPNAQDPVTGASGQKSVWDLIKGKPPILSPKHPHNKAIKNTGRTKEIVQRTIIDEKSEGEEAAKRGPTKFY